MFSTIKSAWKIKDIRDKILFTLFILLIYRIGSGIPVPFLDAHQITQQISAATSGGGALGYLNLMSGGALSQGTLFALGISPYITSSIVVQLLTVAIPYLENLAKEGPEGQKKLTTITRFTALALAVLQSVAYYVLLRNTGGILKHRDGFAGVFAAVVIILTFTAGAMLVVWLGERIDEKGIGNGTSMILFIGIISRAPAAASLMIQSIQAAIAAFKDPQLHINAVEQARQLKELAPTSNIQIPHNPVYNFAWVPVIVVIFLVMIVCIIIMTNAERRIPIQYAKRIVGRKQVGGQSSFFPVKVMLSGVMPVIFAGAILSIPQMILGFAQPDPEGGLARFLRLFNHNQPLYAIIYVLLIIAFNYFYVAIQYEPTQIANNIQRNNGSIPGIRPGEPTAKFIGRIINRITLVGALFLAVLAILPIIFGALSGISIALGGTSIIIVVGVALDTVKQLESMMMMRHYKGFLE